MRVRIGGDLQEKVLQKWAVAHSTWTTYYRNSAFSTQISLELLGHVTGHKREKQGATDWYRDIEEANIRKIEAEWAAKAAAAPVVPVPCRKMAPEAQAWTEELRKRLAAQVAA